MRYFDIVVLDGTLIDHDSFLHADTHFKSVQLKRILDLFNEGRVVDGDIFVFGNAWNYIAIPLSYFRDEYGVEIKLVGFWGNSMFNPHSPMHNRFLRKHRTTAKFFERSLYESYDLNCFFDGLQYNKFQTFFGEKFARTSKSEITGYPFGYLKDVFNANTPKTDTIVMPYYLATVDEHFYYEGLSKSTPMSKYNFIHAYKTHNNRERYSEILKQCKMLFCFQRFEYNPVLIWEGMLNGVIPLVPDIGVFSQMLPEEYQYPESLAIISNRNPLLNVVRRRIQMEMRIIETMDNYKKMAKQMEPLTKKIGNQYYNNSKLLKIFKKWL
jgi:small basic protein